MPDQPAQPGGTGGPERTLLVTGAGPDELRRALSRPDAELLARDDAAAAPTAGVGQRLAIGAPSPRRRALARQIVEAGEPWRGAEDIWYSPRPLLRSPTPTGERGRLAFLFCGLEHSFAPRVDDVADHFGLPRPDVGGTAQIGAYGLAGLGVNWLLDVALRRLGVAPDAVGGHSIGEWNAMITSGMVRLEELGALLPMFRPDVVEIPGVVFGALGCSADDAAPLYAGLPDVVLSHDNSPTQAVVCGPREQVETAVARAQRAGLPATVLSFRSGFHSPHLAPHLAPFRGAAASLPMHRPDVPAWSATTVAPYPVDEPDAVRSLVLRHLVEPVRFRPLVLAMHDAGVRVFVQVGVGSVASFVTDTLTAAGHGADHAAVLTNTSARGGLDQLRRAIAALWAEGAQPRFDLLPRPAGRPDAVAVASQAPTATAAAPAEAVGIPARAGAPAGAAARAATAVLDPPRTGRAPAPVAAGERVVRRTLGVRDFPDVLDHCFYRQPPGWPDLADRFPVVPMTGVLDLMVEHAATLLADPAAARLVAISDVRMLRWLVIEPPADITLTARAAGPGQVRVELAGHARCTVHFAGADATAAGWEAPAAGAARDWPAAGERLPDEAPTDVRPRDLYDGWLFHGPGYQGLTALRALSPVGARGELVCPPARGGLLDSVGQLLGFWAMEYLSHDSLLLPIAVGRIAFHGPPPAPGERFDCTVRVLDVAERTVTADIVVHDQHPGGGQAAARAARTPRITIEGWTDRRFGGDGDLLALMLQPERKALGVARPGGWVSAHDRWTDPASRELAVRHYLATADRAAMAARTPRDAQAFLLGRIAAKDAVRRWLWAREPDADVWGVEVTVDAPPLPAPDGGAAAAEAGAGVARLTSRLAGHGAPVVAFAATAGLGVAVTADSGPLGIGLAAVPTSSGRAEAVRAAEAVAVRQALAVAGSGAGPGQVATALVDATGTPAPGAARYVVAWWRGGRAAAEAGPPGGAAPGRLASVAGHGQATPDT
ncbi:MAG: polyketide synthase dehydratase domain-containing protein [Frankia sp.]|nr:polyketide synthase dehydratase domain-containing protein [Frankia sp.]